MKISPRKITNLWRKSKKFTTNTEGATAIEYGLIVALIALVIIGAATTLGTSISDLFNDTTNAVEDAT